MTITAPNPASEHTLAARFRRINYRWRVVDIVVAAVLAVACGVIFWGWDAAWTPLSKPLEALLPGFNGLLNGVWLFAAVLVGLIVRKPGGALFAEIVAASVEALLGGQWGALTLLSGLVQGIGAEIVLALFLYANWRVVTAILTGLGAAVGLTVIDLLLYYPGAKSEFVLVYAISSLVSGALIAGLLSWVVVGALAKTGALSRFASGRRSAELV